MFCIYKLTRLTDNKSYIGTTLLKRFKIRMREHRKSVRFANSAFIYEILIETSSEQDLYILEKEYIEKFDTYNNGLNLTPTGAGLNDGVKFTTLGFKFSKESREKMSKAKKGKEMPWLKNRKVSPETKAKLSEIGKNKQHSSKLKLNNIIEIRNNFKCGNYDKANVGVKKLNGKLMSELQEYALQVSKKYFSPILYLSL